jgi:hypothetical protein
VTTKNTERQFEMLTDDERREGSADYNLHVGGIRVPGPIADYPPGMRTRYGMSRPANEALVRKLVLRTCQNIRFVSGTVHGLEIDAVDKQALRGVRYRPGDDAKTSVTEEADLVIGGSS